MPGLVWNPEDGKRFAAIRDDLAQVSTATACQLLISLGWRNTYMLGLHPLQPLGLGQRLVGRARTCRYLMRRGAEGPHDPAARRVSPEIVLIEDLAPGDIICIDALGVPTAGIIGDIRGKDVIIFDDEVATGGSIVGLVDILRQNDVSRMTLACTHGLFTGPAIERLAAIPELEEIVTTNTVPIPPEKRLPNMTVLSVASIFAEALRRNLLGRSVGSLFA